MSDKDQEACNAAMKSWEETHPYHETGSKSFEAGWQAARDYYALIPSDKEATTIETHAIEWSETKFIEMYAAKLDGRYVAFKLSSFKDALKRLIIEVYKFSEKQRVQPTVKQLEKAFTRSLRAAGVRFRDKPNPEPGASR